jgi:hypothetical protein
MRRSQREKRVRPESTILTDSPTQFQRVDDEANINERSPLIRIGTRIRNTGVRGGTNAVSNRGGRGGNKTAGSRGGRGGRGIF